MYHYFRVGYRVNYVFWTEEVLFKNDIVFFFFYQGDGHCFHIFKVAILMNTQYDRRSIKR